jgi:hypothetical protein
MKPDPLLSRKELKLKVFENRVLRGVFGAKSSEELEGRIKLDNVELYDLSYPPITQWCSAGLRAG